MFIFFLIFFFLYLLLCPEAALASTQGGLLLWYRSVLPVLFPFMLLSGLLLKFDALRRLPPFWTKPLRLLFGVSERGAFAVVSGFLCGFPMGAKVTADLRREGQISEREARRLSGFANNVSPAFLLSYVAAEQMNCPQHRLLFLAPVLGAAALYGTLTAPRTRARGFSDAVRSAAAASRAFEPSAAVRNAASASHTRTLKPSGTVRSAAAASRPSDLSDVFQRIDGCIHDTVWNTVRLGVYITVFKILSDALLRALPLSHPAFLFLGASIEVTGGVHLLASSQLPFPLKYVLVNALCAFGGFSALAQTTSIGAFGRDQLFSYIKSRAVITLLCIVLSVIYLLLLGFRLFV